MAFLTNATTDRKILKVDITINSVCILSVQPSTQLGKYFVAVSDIFRYAGLLVLHGCIF